MDYEKKYKEALKRAKDMMSYREVRREDMEYLFPELKESEDERVRKSIIAIINNYVDNSNTFKPQMIAWLEKQGNVNTLIQEASEKSYNEGMRIERKRWIEKQNEQKTFDTDTIKKKAHQIAWEISKHYDPNACKQEWCEMAAIDMASWLEKQYEQKPRGKSVFEAAREEVMRFISLFEKQKPDDKVDNANKVELKDYNTIDPHFFKTAEKVEPKFRVEKDKWYVCTSQYCNCIEGRNYKASLDGRIIDDYGTEYDMHDDAYRWFRPWTIQDAKDGDVLISGRVIFIFDKIHGVWVNCYCCLFNDGSFDIMKHNLLHIKYCKVYPATKEQRDTLMKAITDAGYEWDADKKKLNKVEPKFHENENTYRHS